MEVDVDDSARQGRGEVVRILITIRRWRTEGPGERDGESDEIVRELEKGLTKWKGFVDIGWMDEVGPERHIEIVHAIKSYKDIV